MRLEDITSEGVERWAAGLTAGGRICRSGVGSDAATGGEAGPAAADGPAASGVRPTPPPIAVAATATAAVVRA
jgi:hypothetical protein